ncbi:MAG TPA: calcium-binding protein, partial [Dongiaceae bacterium]|nr:calcium-binding protein [Dongiaceae bacterium]
LTGTSGNDSLYGDNNANTLDGGVGNDYLDGRGGNDTYIFGRGYGQDSISDTLTANVLQFNSDTAASDILLSRVGSGNNDLVLTIAGTTDKVTIIGYFSNASQAPIAQITFSDGTAWDYTSIKSRVFAGTSSNDTLVGTAQSDYINGGVGADVMQGYAGNDTYVVDNAGDQVIETAGGGYDVVYASLNYSLPSDVEELVLTSGATGTGNSLNNRITGNASVNTLDGGAGADTLIGGAGNDTYIVDNVGDIVIENAGEGTDTVQSSVSYVLSANVENLTLTGGNSSNGTGNSLANAITGNAATNTLDGAGGADTLTGNGGYDQYLFNSGYGSLTVVNSTVSNSSASGELDFGSGVTAQNLWFAQSGQDLVVDVLGTNDKVTVKGWFGSNGSAKLSEIKTADGKEIDSGINQLVSAMATYQANNASFNPTLSGTAMPTDTNLQNTVAASWH